MRGLFNHHVDRKFLMRDGSAVRIEGGQQNDIGTTLPLQGAEGQIAVLPPAPEQQRHRSIRTLGRIRQPCGLLYLLGTRRKFHTIMIERTMAASGTAAPFAL